MIEEIKKLIQEYVDTLKTLPAIPPYPKCPENASLEVFLQWKQDLGDFKRRESETASIKVSLFKLNTQINKALGVAPSGTEIVYEKVRLVRDHEGWSISLLPEVKIEGVNNNGS